ncbi:MAG: glycosyl hydrolase, partial [Xanthomonadales bacterium]|nr:fibronectin type III-like domain-contianing protein [Gammaproteobacteria bacterium]NNK03620.1 glycosyl hydrolase [Xanthomonadales bacterium]
PLTLANIIDNVDAMLFAWHPGSMGGPAIAKVLFGAHSPSGKLPVTFPRMVGQVPVYYAHKNTGKPATAETYLNIDDIPVRMSQTSAGMVSTHMDAGITPQYPFGYGLSYTRFSYADISVSNEQVPMGGKLTIVAVVTNAGDVAADEIAQLYVRDLVGNVTRPVRELKGFTRLHLQPGESRQVSFELDTSDLAFYGRQMQLMTEPGEFHAWIGGSSEASLQTGFTIVDE